MRKPLSLIGILLLLSACSTPRYQLVYDFDPPAGGNGAACIQACYQDQKNCQLACTGNHDACLARSQEIAEEEYRSKLAMHDQAVQDYYADQKAYETQRALFDAEQKLLQNQLDQARHRCKREGHGSYACQRTREVEKEMSEQQAPLEPARPPQPSLNDEIKRAQLTCNRNCNYCEETYRTCYTSCGGKVSARRVCVADCD